jgi:PhnB protein
MWCQGKPLVYGQSITDGCIDWVWGDRYGQLEDPFGHRWSVATHQRDLSPAEIKEAMENMSKEQKLQCGP